MSAKTTEQRLREALDKATRLLGALPIEHGMRERWHEIFTQCKEALALPVSEPSLAEAEKAMLEALDALDRGCSCHSYECHCDSDNNTAARAILRAALRQRQSQATEPQGGA